MLGEESMSYLWSWPTLDRSREISDGGDSDAHIVRIGHPGIDVPSHPVRNTVSPARLFMPVGIHGRVSSVITNPSASPCGIQLDVWWVWDNAYWEQRTCHWARLNVQAGDTFDSSTVMGEMGRTGNPAPDGVHQHCVMKRDGAWVRPEDYRLLTTEEPDMPAQLTDDEKTEATALVDILYGVGRMLKSEQAMPDTLDSIGEQTKQAAVRVKELLGL
jgi:hypothetical protein